MQETAETIPQRIGRYDVLGELGHGGMAVVYRARDPRLDREVAIKVLHPHLARDPESRARFEREARAAARLRHPGIVEVYEFSDANERESYMVTELLEGPTLRRFAELHPGMLPEVVAAIGVVLCDALTCAHGQGVVHRDVKPDNMLLQRGGRLKLTDFGIAHVADMREMTATGQVLGSPAHMAPEQIEGDSVDARTDVFAAGTVLYLLAVGRLPFDGATAQALLRKILEGEYTDPVRVKPAVGERFARVLRRAMARVPADRYASAAAMRQDLVDYLAEVGWDQPEAELARYFADPEAFTAALRERLLVRLPELGVQARGRGDLAAAMGYFNRALALDPGNVRVLALVRAESRRRAMKRRVRAAGIVLAVATVTAAAVLGVGRITQGHPGTRPVAPARVETVTRVEPREEPTGEPREEPAVRVTQHPVAVPAEPAVPPAGVGVVAGVRRPRQGIPAGRVLDAGAVATRELVLAPRPAGVWYSVDGSPRVQWSMLSPTLGTYAVGRRVRVTLSTPDDPDWQPRVMDIEVTQGPGSQLVRGILQRRNPNDATAAVVTDAALRQN